MVRGVAVVVALGLALGAWAQGQATAYLQEIGAKAAAMEKAGTMAVAGKDGQLFFGPDLRTISIGRFWGPEAAKVCRTLNPADADPIPAILDFKAQCDKAGVELVLVPVPGKATIYPETISAAAPPAGARADIYHAEFYETLAKNGVQVLDLTPVFLQHRNDPEGLLYCKQDTHWSPRAIALTAGLLGERYRDRPWRTQLAASEQRHYEAAAQSLTMTGDLWTMMGDANLAKETVTVSVVRERAAAGLFPVESWRDSPVILLGDSHCLVFQVGDDMFCKGAGLASQLALQFGFPVDLVGVRGSGATPARVNLMRRKDNLAGKKLIIWCFSVREFTEGQGWKKVPIVK